MSTNQAEKNTISAQQFYFKDEESVTNGTALQCHLWELEVDLLAGELLVDGAEGLRLVLNVGLLGLVQMNLEQACSVQADPKIFQLRILIFLFFCPDSTNHQVELLGKKEF